MDMIFFVVVKFDYFDIVCKEWIVLNIVYILFLMNIF